MSDCSCEKQDGWANCCKVKRLEKENEQLGKNVTHWMEESFKWNKRSQAERSALKVAEDALAFYANLNWKVNTETWQAPAKEALAKLKEMKS